MPSDLRVLLGTSPLAPNGEAYETYKLQADDTYAKAVFAYVNDATPLRVQFPLGTPAITANFTQTQADPALRTTLEQAAPLEVTLQQAAPLEVTVANQPSPVQFPAVQAVAVQQEPTDAPIRVILDAPMYSVATTTQDGLFASTDRVAFENLKAAYKLNAASEPTVDKNFFVNMPSMAPTDHANAYVIGGDKRLRLTAYPSTHGSRASQVWVNAETPDTRLVFGVNNAPAGGFSPNGESFNVGAPTDDGDEGKRMFVYNDRTSGDVNSIVRAASREGEAAVILTGKASMRHHYTGLDYQPFCTAGIFADTLAANKKDYSIEIVNKRWDFQENGQLKSPVQAGNEEFGWRNLNGLHFVYDQVAGTATNPWVKIGNYSASSGEGAIVFEVLTITDYNFEGFNSAEVCLKRFRPWANGSVSMNIKPTSENDSGIYFGFNPTTGDIFIKCLVLWGSVASYRVKFANVPFEITTPAIFTGTVENEVGSGPGFPKTKRIETNT